jgi:Protein of unknown function (DUF3987)
MHPAAEFVVSLFGPHKTGRVNIVSLPNIKGGKPDGAPIYTRSSKQITDFVTRHDRAGFGCFVCVNPIKDKATRRAEETVVQIVCAHSDIDFAQVEETPEDIERAVAALPWPPSRVHHSGHGLHLYWFLQTALAASPENNAQHKRLLEQIASLLGGDTAACLIPQLMRLPGTTNSKNGEQHAVRVLSDCPDLRYAYAELEQLVAATPAPLLHRKIATKDGNGASPDNPFLAFAAAYAETAPLDVDQLLADMLYRGGGGGGNAHETLLRCSAALLTRGEQREVVVERCLAALALAAARSGLTIDPGKEQVIIADMCDSWIAKHPPESEQHETEEEPADDAQTKDKPVGSIPAPIIPVDLWSTFNPPRVPHGLLPSVIEDFAFEQGATMGADPAGLAVGALVVCAAAVPDRIELRVKRYSVWNEATRLWGGLVGDPSTKKSPIIRQVMRPLERIDTALWETYAAAKAQWDALDKDTKRMTPPPQQIRVKLDDATVEAAQEILRDSPDGVLYLRDELSGFFGSMDKYAGYRGSASDRGFWLQAYNGGGYTFDRIKRGAGRIPHLSVSVLGGIQPEAMRKLTTDTIDDGLIQRLVPIMLQSGGVGRDEEMSRSVEAYESLVERLHQMQPPTINNVVFEDAARAVREDMERKHCELATIEIINKKLSAHVGKYDGIFARLCLLWHCIENPGTELPPQIGAACAQRVADFLSRFLFPHALAFYTSIYGLSDDHDRLTAVAGYILAHKVDRLTNRVIQRGDSTMRGLKRLEIENICHQLNALGWITEAPRRRLTDPSWWDVNPEVHRRFQERAKQEETRRQQAHEKITEYVKAQEKDDEQ